MTVEREQDRDANRAVILFDGVCNLCNGSVLFIIRRDPHGYFSFAALQSRAGEQLLRGHGAELHAEHGFEGDELQSVILIDSGRTYTRSDAALRIASRLRGAWPLLGVFRIVPRFVRDRVYDLIAKHRYRAFGRRDECMIPTPELRQRFLE